MNNSKTQSKKLMLFYDKSKCTNCRLCELVCSFKHYGVFEFEKSCIKNLFSFGKNETEVAHCFHCDVALCMDSCPTGAIYRNERGYVLINPMKCIGCKNCISACPLGVIWFHEREGVAKKCDFCEGMLNCADYCPTGALTVVPREEYKKRVLEIYGFGGD
ncbi:MAG TPA: 4Fe-4S dicluster domain-containing protein [Thermoplasmata archaeon]|nr:4Fe-4S dicluster domain-containing protein [Thermoplasmata archaeon]